jgi:biotin synthase-like enzyme
MDIIIHILQNLPNEYKNTVELLENNLENEVANLERVKEKLRNKFDKIQRSKINSEGALMTNEFKPGKYKGNCSYCGMYGHKANMCNKRTKVRSKKGMKNEKGSVNVGKFNTPFPFYCYICNQKGH